MTRTTPLILLGALASLSALGCSGGGGSSSSASSAAPATSATSTAPTQSSTPAPTQSGAPPASATGSGGSGGVPGDFTLTYQQRDYRLIVPSSYATTRPMPLLLAFHGSGDTADNFADALDAGGWLAAAEQAGVILVVPETKSPFQSFPVWSGDPNNDIPDMQAELAEVVDLLRQGVFTRYDVDTAQTHALGFSDGGLFTAAVALGEPLFATHSIWGYGWGAAYVTPPSRAGPVSLVCGTSDRFFAGASASQAFLDQQGHEVDWQPLQGVGHTLLGLSQVRRPADALAWMLARPLPGGSAATPPAMTPPAPASRGSGGTGGQAGLNQLQATSQAAAGLPSLRVGYDVYAPANYDPQVAYPVVFAANMGLAPWRALADQEGIVVVDFRDHDRNGGYNFNYDVLLLNALIGEVESTFNIDRTRRYFHGFSAGAHWGYVVVLANANSFAALGVNAGSMGIAIQQGVWPGQVQRRIPVAIRHGDADAVVPVAAGQRDRARLQSAGHPVAYEEFGGGHVVRAADAAALWSFLRNHTSP